MSLRGRERSGEVTIPTALLYGGAAEAQSSTVTC